MEIHSLDKKTPTTDNVNWKINKNSCICRSRGLTSIANKPFGIKSNENWELGRKKSSGVDSAFRRVTETHISPNWQVSSQNQVGLHLSIFASDLKRGYNQRKERRMVPNSIGAGDI